jgi:hypothetical protein
MPAQLHDAEGPGTGKEAIGLERRQPQAKARMKRWPRRSSAYISIMKVSASTPKSVSMPAVCSARRLSVPLSASGGEDEAERFQPVGRRFDRHLNLIGDSDHLEPEERTATPFSHREVADPHLDIVASCERVAETTGSRRSAAGSSVQFLTWSCAESARRSGTSSIPPSPPAGSPAIPSPPAWQFSAP